MKLSNKTLVLALFGTLALGIIAGWILFGTDRSTAADEKKSTTEDSTQEQTWTCSMHPQIRKNEPGDCPICGMDLIPVSSKGQGPGANAVSMSSTAVQLANINTATVGMMNAIKKVRLNGKVQEDERLVFSQASHIPGRIEDLMVNFTGEYVKKGQVLAKIYSPDLVTAQEELFEARKLKGTQPRLYQSAREKLRNWKLSESQIEQITQSDSPIESFPITAGVSGYVIEKNVNTGDYIRQGESIYEIADLSKVWVLFDVYESDLPWINEGDAIDFTIRSLPGEQFDGEIDFLDPVIDPMTRVARARVSIDNPNRKLKPEMFASGVVEAHLQTRDDVLAVPKSSVMWTGKRSVVYVKQGSQNGIDFIMREVTLGPALGESYIIEEGLEAGEEIAISGTFSIDAAAQLAGKPSMMAPKGDPELSGMSKSGKDEPDTNQGKEARSIKLNEQARRAIRDIVKDYLTLKDALVNDDIQLARSHLENLQTAIQSVNSNWFKGESARVWSLHSGNISSSLNSLNDDSSIDEVREQFRVLSNEVITLARVFKPFETPLYIQHCPMVNDNEGADWLSETNEILNPYFGDKMLKCGSNTDTLR